MVSRSWFRLCFLAFLTLRYWWHARQFIYSEIFRLKRLFVAESLTFFWSIKLVFVIVYFRESTWQTKALCWKLAQKNRSAHMGFVVIKFSVHLFIMVFKWLVSRQIRYMPGCELFVFLACIQMYVNLWYFMVHILNDFCLNFK